MKVCTKFALMLSFTLVFTAWAAGGWAADDARPSNPTFHKDIVPILQANCQGCHRPSGANLGGMVAPMALIDYREVRPWARSIAEKVQSREMPPWFATEETQGQFVNEKVLTTDEIATIVKWAETGARKGRPEDAPEPLVWENTGGWAIGTPDLIISLADPFWVSDDVVDLNISLKAEEITAEMLPEARYIAAAEFRPGSEAVHHIIGSRRHQGAEEPGATGMIGGIAPGTAPFVLPEGYGRLLMPGTDLYFQMHYHKEAGPGTGVWDYSQIALKFHPKDAKIDHQADWTAIGNNSFEIPPGHSEWMVGASRIFERETTIFAYMPHMHLRGKAAKYVAYYPDGTTEILLDVPKYDFNWQVNYTYKEPKTIPAGTRIEVSMWFDNSTERSLLAPEIDIDRSIRFGGPTTDEMMLGWLDWAYEDAGGIEE